MKNFTKREAVDFLKSKGVVYLKGETLRTALDKFENAPDRKVHTIGVSTITDQASLDAAHFAFDRAASTGKENYPVGMSSCYVVGLNGDCGLNCPVLANGDCEVEEEMGVDWCGQCSEMITDLSITDGEYYFCSEECKNK